MRPRSPPRALFLIAALLGAACEDDALAPTGGFRPTDCPPSEPNCDTSGRIDAGLGSLDTGANNNGADAGPAADTGLPPPPDSGVATVDSGPLFPPDSGIVGDAGTIADFLNLAGTHDTEYLFDWSAYLFGIANIAGPLDTIAQVVSGNINTGFPPLDALIRAVVSRFVPPWLVTVINVLNGIANFFEEVEVTGTLNLSQDLPTAGPTGPICALHGTETWNTLTVRLINLCPQGRQTPGFPACARQQINIVPAGRTGVGPLDVEVDVHAFDGVLQPGRPQADFVLEDREIDIDLYKLVTIAIDLAINLGTNGQIPSLSAALNQIIDCAGLQAEAYNIATSFGLNNALATAAALAVRQTCDREKQRAIDAVINGLNGIGLGLVGFDYDQLGRAVDGNNNQRADTLQVMTTPDTIDGRFRVIISDPLGGTWRGTNRSP